MYDMINVCEAIEMNMYMLDKINFHDADIYNYIREGNDIFLN